MSRINLGDVAKDTITGFEGVVVARTEWLMGCDRLTVQPEKLTAEGKVADTVTFDEQQLLFVRTGQHSQVPAAPMPPRPARSEDPGRPLTGGPRPEPVRR